MRSSSGGKRSPNAKAPSQSVRGKLSDRIAQLRQYREELSNDYLGGLNTSRDRSLQMSPASTARDRGAKQQVLRSTSRELENVLASQDLDETASNMVKYWLTYQSPTKERAEDSVEERAAARTMDYRINKQHIAKALSTIKANQARSRANRRRDHQERSSEDESDPDVKRRARRAERKTAARSGGYREHFDYGDEDCDDSRIKGANRSYHSKDIYPSPSPHKATGDIIDAVKTVSSWLKSSVNDQQRRKLKEAIHLIAQASDIDTADAAAGDLGTAASAKDASPLAQKASESAGSQVMLPPQPSPQRLPPAAEAKDIFPSPSAKVPPPLSRRSPEVVAREVSAIVASGGADHSALKTTVALLLEAVEEQGRLRALLQYSGSSEPTEHADPGARTMQEMSSKYKGLQLEVERLVFENVRLRGESDKHFHSAEESEKIIEILRNRLQDAEDEAAELRQQLSLKQAGDHAATDTQPRTGLPPVAPRRARESASQQPGDEGGAESADSPGQERDRLVLSIDVGDGTSFAVTILRNSDPIALADDFVRQHGLSESYFKPLAHYIAQTQSRHFAAEEGSGERADTASPGPSSQQPPQLHKSVTFAQQADLGSAEGEDISFNVSESSASPSSANSPRADSPFSASSSPFSGAAGNRSSPSTEDIDTSIISCRDVTAAEGLTFDETIISAANENGLYVVPASPPVPPPCSTPPSTASIATPSYFERRPSQEVSAVRMALDEDEDDLHLLSMIGVRASQSLREKENILRAINESIALKERRAAESAQTAQAVDQDKFSAAIEYFNRATALANDGDLEAAIPLYNHSLDLFRGTGYKEINLVQEEVAYWTNLAHKLSEQKSKNAVASGSSSTNNEALPGRFAVSVTENKDDVWGALPRRARTPHARPPPPPLPSTSEFLSPPP